LSLGTFDYAAQALEEFQAEDTTILTAKSQTHIPETD
jgi:hypothetical protein